MFTFVRHCSNMANINTREMGSFLNASLRSSVGHGSVQLTHLQGAGPSSVAWCAKVCSLTYVRKHSR
jgi:hypothetical protein